MGLKQGETRNCQVAYSALLQFEIMVDVICNGIPFVICNVTTCFDEGLSLEMSAIRDTKPHRRLTFHINRLTLVDQTHNQLTRQRRK